MSPNTRSRVDNSASPSALNYTLHLDPGRERLAILTTRQIEAIVGRRLEKLPLHTPLDAIVVVASFLTLICSIFFALNNSGGVKGI